MSVSNMVTSFSEQGIVVLLAIYDLEAGVDGAAEPYCAQDKEGGPEQYAYHKEGQCQYYGADDAEDGLGHQGLLGMLGYKFILPVKAQVDD